MHKLRLLIVFIVAATCPFLGVLHIGHTGITDNMALGSCSALSIGGGATSSSVDNESGSSSFFTGEPIDIPVSIAKGIEPVDATRFQVSAGGGLNLVKPQSQLLVKQLSASVTISGQTQQTESTVVAFVNGVQIAEMYTGSGRTFSFDTTTTIYSKPIAFVVRGTAGRVSYPVILTIEPSNDTFSTLHTTTHITNVTGIVNERPAVSKDEVAYTALDLNDNPVVAYSPIDGGFPLVLSSEPDSLLTSLGYSKEGDFLVGVDDAGIATKIQKSTGVVTDVATLYLSPYNITLAPNDAYIFTFTTSEEDLVGLTLFDMALPTNLTNLRPSNDLESMGNINLFDVGWVTSDIIFLSAADTALAQTYLMIVDLKDIVGTTFAASTGIPFLLALQTNFTLDHLRANPNNTTEFAAECTNISGYKSICRSDFETVEALIPSGSGYSDIANPAWTADGQFIIFQATYGGQSVIAAYSLEDDSVLNLAPGYSPEPSTTNHNIVLYFSGDSLGYTQVSVLNLALHPLTENFF